MAIIADAEKEHEAQRDKGAAEKHGHVVVEVAVVRPDVNAHLIPRNEPRSAQQRKLARQKSVPAVKLRQNTAHERAEREYPDYMVCR